MYGLAAEVSNKMNGNGLAAGVGSRMENQQSRVGCRALRTVKMRQVIVWNQEEQTDS